ncbi:GNAT family N-acetyltransferase [Marinobacterium aestuariivivens]|uniref:GNAT family N-acetyltransferase n=1 Tax=Marinobacterium aestuariivivens TaxID=1698799 RepID=A0ABW2A6X8_9GAMM
MIIRQITEKDLDIASAICMAAFNESVAGSLSEEGISTFEKIASPDAFLKRMQEDNVILVSEEQGEVKGIVELKEGRHVAMFFVDPRCQRRGVGKRLLSSALEHARADVISVSASLSSVPVYISCGFECKGGVAELSGLIYQPMELKMSTPPGAELSGD